MNEAAKIAFSWPVVRRSLLIAVIVGSILILINHGSGLLRGDMDTTCLAKCGLTMIVPYCVSTVSCVWATLDRCKHE